MNIDIKNIDKVIFQNKALQKVFINYKNLFDQWIVGQRVPALSFLSQKSRLALLEELNVDQNIIILEKFFNEKVQIKTIDYHIVKNKTMPLHLAENNLNEMGGFGNNFTISRDQDHVYISFWK